MGDQLSHRWRTVLNKIAEYGDEGVSERDLSELLGGGELVRTDPVRGIISEMFFTTQLIEPVYGTRDHIRITDAGRKALGR